MDLNGKTIIVTGASRGIGRQLALELGRRGANVVVAARTIEPRRTLPGTVGATVADIEAGGGSALAIRCDVTQPDDLEKLVSTAVDHFGHLDGVVNNAAEMADHDLESMVERMLGRNAEPAEQRHPLDAWRAQFATNVHAPFYLTMLAVPHLRRQGGGVIINISSEVAEPVPVRELLSLSRRQRRARNSSVGYAATKAALNRLSNAMAAELFVDGIAVVAVDPGVVQTEVRDMIVEHGFLDPAGSVAMSVPVAAVIDVLTRDDWREITGTVIRAVAEPLAPG